MSEAAGTPDPDAIRASDADREAIVQRLQQAFSEGRLDMSELEERTSGVYAARTFGDLKGFTADLPGGESAARVDLPRPAPSPPARRDDDSTQPESAPSTQSSRGTPAPFALLRFGMPPVILVCLVIWGISSATNGHVDGFWPAWLLIPWAFGAFGGHHHGRRHHEHPRRRDHPR